MIAVTWSPAFLCSAIVPPQPNSSSSGCAAITNTLLFISPDFARPRLVAQIGSLQSFTVVTLQLQQRDSSLSASDQLSTCICQWTMNPTKHLSRNSISTANVRQQ